VGILILDGCSQETALHPVLKSLPEAELVKLEETEIAWCRGCFHCWILTPGQCIIGDTGNEIARKFMNSKLAILLTPVTFGGYSANLKRILDRLIPNFSGLCTQHQGETHHVKRYSNYPVLAVLGIQSSPDSEAAAIFSQLAHRNSLNFYPDGYVSHVFLESLDQGTIQAELAQTLAAVGVKI
jgi:multimeric flavodoxin WrbA